MYRRTQSPAEFDSSWLDRELNQVEQAFSLSEQVQFQVLSNPPAKPREGMLVLAAGYPDWDPIGDGVVPGDNAGLYLFTNGVWTSVPTQTSGLWTPVYTFLTPGDISVVYSIQTGSWSRTGRMFIAHYDVAATATFTTGSGDVRITGVPIGPRLGTQRGAVRWGGINKVGGYTQIVSGLNIGDTNIAFTASGMGLGGANVVAADTISGVPIRLSGNLVYTV